MLWRHVYEKWNYERTTPKPEFLTAEIAERRGEADWIDGLMD
jgi:hypothetical protein